MLLVLCLFPVLVPAHPVPGALSFPPCYPQPVTATRIALTGIAATDYVYAADLDSDRILEIDPSSGRRQFSWGCLGRAIGQFDFGLNEDAGIAVDQVGNIYVADSDNARIQRFDSRGHFMLSWSSPFPQLFYPVAVAVDKLGNIYAVDFDSARVLKFNRFGHFLLAWGSPGRGDGQFTLPDGIAIDDQDNVYVVDRENARIEKFDSTGHFLTTWGEHGRGDGQLAEPVGIAVNRQGRVYVADHGNHRIELFDSKGHFLTVWDRGSSSTSPTGVAVGGDGTIYVVSQGTASCTIQKFTPSGKMGVDWTC